jgi:iron-sulfur cluster assembly protein
MGIGGVHGRSREAPSANASNIEEGVGAMVTMTRTATEKVQDFIQEHGVDGPVGLRVAVLPGGCSGFQYGLNIEDAPEDDDEVLDISGVRVFVDPFSAQYLSGVEIDYVSSMMGQGFTFRNPNASSGCGCGSSFTV